MNVYKWQLEQDNLVRIEFWPHWLWLALAIACTFCPSPLVLQYIYIQGYMRIVLTGLELVILSNYKRAVKKATNLFSYTNSEVSSQ